MSRAGNCPLPKSRKSEIDAASGMSARPVSAAASGTARGLWLQCVAAQATPERMAGDVDRLCIRIGQGLGRWIGPSGYRSVLDRARLLVEAEHPALAGLSLAGGGEAAFVVAIQAYGAGAMAEGMIAVIGGVIELLGRIVGLEMAMHLLEEIARPSAPGVVGKQLDGEPDA